MRIRNCNLCREADDAAGPVAVSLALLRGVRAAGGGGGGRLVPPLPQRLLSRPQAGLRIRIHFIRIRIQHFRLNTFRSGSRALMTKN
jgi:hypothetical protein